MDVLARLGELPGGGRLLAVATPATYLVGGAVRDLLVGRAPRELDVVVEGDAAALATALGAVAVEHRRFGTALVELPDGARIDFAAARRERYAAPGALPEVEPATLAEDLLRRDFTVNAIAMALAGARAGELRAAAHALEDLRAGSLRVLHERSFIDDPTRLWRLGRYRARLGFAIEERTAELAAQAVAAGALATISGARAGAELRLALAEPDPLETLAEIERLGLLGALHPRLRFERALMERALELLVGGCAMATRDAGAPAAGGRLDPDRLDGERPDRGDLDPGRLDGGRPDGDGPDRDRPDLLMLAGIALPLALRVDREPSAIGRGAEIAALLQRLEFTAGERDRAAAAAAAVPELIDALPAAERPSLLRAAVARVPPEGVALAGALSAPAAEPARRWLRELRHVGLRISGEDLLAAGVSEGPQIGRLLEATLALRLDGELSDERDAQLRAVLALV